MGSGIVTIPSVMDIYDVREMFSRYYVDPDIAKQNVPSKWKVKIHDNGVQRQLHFPIDDNYTSPFLATIKTLPRALKPVGWVAHCR